MRVPLSQSVTTTRRRPWRAGASVATAGALALASATLAMAPATPAQAQTECLTVEYESVTWHSGPDHGGMYVNVTLTNSCDTPAADWLLELTLAPGHQFDHGWNADWGQIGSLLTATALAWNQTLAPGGTTMVGFVGSWTGTPQDPLSCLLNGAPCAGWPAPGEPPEVTLTTPADEGIVAWPCPVILTAEADSATASIDRVEFYVNDELVGSVDEAPYQLYLFDFLPAFNPVAPNIAYARAIDDGNPPATADSTPAAFHLSPMPPAIMVLSCADAQEVAPGDTVTIGFRAACVTAPAMQFGTTGEIDLSITPTAVPPGETYHEVSVTVAPDSPTGTGRVTASPDEVGCLGSSTHFTVLPG